MKEAFTNDLHMSRKNQERLELINSIIEEYRAQGYRLTLRQLYYQLVSRDVIPNKQSEYNKLSTLLTKGRMAGVVDWSAIEDRIRVPKLPYYAEDIADALRDITNSYRLDRQAGQSVYVEVWCEKDALSQVLYRVTSQYHVRMMVNRGYSSTTAMHDAYERFDLAQSEGKELVILYVGDHDPSGLDMLRDIHDRLIDFGLNVDVVPVALTEAQIDEHNPPPNPAKITDPRAGEYIALHGNTSWEVDALPPQVLHKLVEQAILDRIDIDEYEQALEQEDEDKKALRAFQKVDKDDLQEVWDSLRNLSQDSKTKKLRDQAQQAADAFHKAFGDLLYE